MSELQALQFQDLLGRVRVETDTALIAFFEAERALPGRRTASVTSVLDALSSLTMRGGKRLRAALCAIAFEGYGGAPGRCVPAMVALELLQTYFLVHDDWMDQDEVRRGGPAVHAMLRQTHGAAGDAFAILAGDYACAAAQRVLSTVQTESASRARAYEVFASMQADVIAGQLIDMHGRERTLSDVEQMYALKTGSYTVAGPLLLGACLAGASAEALDQVRAFAAPLGVAFQLKDDLLGTFGATEHTGKPTHTDLRRKKRNALVVALEAAGHGPLVAELAKDGDPSEALVQELASAMRATGVPQLIDARVRALCTDARERLGALELSMASQIALDGAISALGERAA
jgi:geranylgeranyl diphosphate synthase, type I